MMNTIDQGTKLFGLLELDPAGMVLYSYLEKEGAVKSPIANITGHDFFAEVATFRNVEEFQECLDNFTRSSQQVASIGFTCQYDDGPVQVKVLLARIRERPEGQRTKSILVHIQKVQH